MDGGAGPDDYLVIFMGGGDVVLYGGADIGPADKWAQLGTYYIGSPLGRDPIVKFGGDAIAMTVDGFFLLSNLVKAGRRGSDHSISDLVYPLLGESIKGRGVSPRSAGWQALLYPVGNQLIFNVPRGGEDHYQLVMNMKTGAWCRYLGQNAERWSLFDDSLYFYSGNKIFKADTGELDDGELIEGACYSAYNAVRGKGEKAFQHIRPHIRARGDVNIEVVSDVDFSEDYTGDPISIVTDVGRHWDTAMWNTFPFEAISRVTREWQVLNHQGVQISVGLRSRTKTDRLEWYSTDLHFENARGEL